MQPRLPIFPGWNLLGGGSAEFMLVFFGILFCLVVGRENVLGYFYQLLLYYDLLLNVSVEGRRGRRGEEFSVERRIGRCKCYVDVVVRADNVR